MKTLGYSLIEKQGYFQLFPTYWELIPVRLEMAGMKDNIGNNKL